MGTAAEQPAEEFVDDILEPDEPEQEQAEPSGPPAQPRDELGRFAEQQPPGDESEPGGPPAPAAPPPGDQAPAEAQYEPYRYRIEHRDFDIPGSKVGSDGIFIPQDQEEWLRRVITRGARQAQTDREIAQRIQAAKAEGEDALARARSIMEGIDNLRQTYRNDPEGFQQWLSEYDRNYDLMIAKAENSWLKQRLESGDAERQEQDLERQAEALIPELERATDVMLDRLLADDRFKVLAGDRAALRDRVLQSHLFDAVFSEDPETHEVMVDQGALERELAFLARGRAAPTTVAPKAPTVAPPTVPVGGGAAPGPKALPEFKDKAELEKWLNSGKWMDDVGVR